MRVDNCFFKSCGYRGRTFAAVLIPFPLVCHQLSHPLMLLKLHYWPWWSSLKEQHLLKASYYSFSIWHTSPLAYIVTGREVLMVQIYVWSRFLGSKLMLLFDPSLKVMSPKFFGVKWSPRSPITTSLVTGIPRSLWIIGRRAHYELQNLKIYSLV